MSTLSRKQREIQEREARILEAARSMLATEGYLKLNMDRIAERIEYSKGTVYQHFRNKEDIIVALDIHAYQTMEDLFRRASAFDGPPRFRMAAVGVASVLSNRLHPDHSQILQVTCNPAILDKASETRRQQRKQVEGACMFVLAGIVRDAVEVGHLCLGVETAPEDLVFGLWSMSTGAYEIMASGIPLLDKGVRRPLDALWNNFNMLLDGYGWKPLSSEQDYADVRRRAWQKLFAADYASFEPDWLAGETVVH